MTAITAAAADGAITPGEALALSRVIDTRLRALAAREAERRQRRFLGRAGARPEATSTLALAAASRGRRPAARRGQLN
jgi:hypothetical protein